MTSRRAGLRYAGLALILALTAPGIARAQSGLDDMPCFPYPPMPDLGLGIGPAAAAGIAPFAYGFGLGSLGATGCGSYGPMTAYPLPGYGVRISPMSWAADPFPSLQELNSVNSSRSVLSNPIERGRSPRAVPARRIRNVSRRTTAIRPEGAKQATPGQRPVNRNARGIKP